MLAIDRILLGLPNRNGWVLRLRLPELLEEREMTPYALAKASRGRISMSTAYRLARLKGRVETFDRSVSLRCAERRARRAA